MWWPLPSLEGCQSCSTRKPCLCSDASTERHRADCKWRFPVLCLEAGLTDAHIFLEVFFFPIKYNLEKHTSFLKASLALVAHFILYSCNYIITFKILQWVRICGKVDKDWPGTYPDLAEVPLLPPLNIWEFQFQLCFCSSENLLKSESVLFNSRCAYFSKS